MRRVCSWIATLGPIGYLPAPGTCATVVSVPCVYGLQLLVPHSGWYFALAGVSFFLATIIVHNALPLFPAVQDPSQIVIDEFVGTLFTFWMIPFSFVSALLGFVLFRFFDITKLFGIRSCEQISGATGIMLDDVAAAILSNFILHILVFHAL